jgi:hypothetical protein
MGQCIENRWISVPGTSKAEGIKRGVVKLLRFIDDDAAYLNWKAAHPHGFVVNSEPHPKGDYIKLHRATCQTLKTPPKAGGGWTTTYIKTCDLDVNNLEAYFQRETSQLPTPCKLCNPKSAS